MPDSQKETTNKGNANTAEPKRGNSPEEKQEPDQKKEEIKEEKPKE